MTADFVDHGPTGGIEGVAAFKELVRHPVVPLVPREEAS
jgi:hypothetical protein